MVGQKDDYKVTIGMNINQGGGADIEEKQKKDDKVQTKNRRSSRKRINDKQESEPLSSVKKKMQKKVGKGRRKIIGKRGGEE
jgi:hypothetical protein